MPSYCLECGENTKKHYFSDFKSYKRWNNNIIKMYCMVR